MYNDLKKALAEAKAAGNKPAVSDIICVIDAVDKKVFADKKKAEGDFLIKDVVVIAVIKNQVKNLNKDYERAVSLVGVTDDTEAMQSTVSLLSSFLPQAIEGDDLRLLIQSLGAASMGQAMGLLKKHAESQGFDYDGREASGIAKEIFV